MGQLRMENWPERIRRKRMPRIGLRNESLAILVELRGGARFQTRFSASHFRRRGLVTWRLVVTLALVLGCRSSLVAQSVAVRFARLIPMRGGPIDDAVVVVSGDRVSAVASGDRAVPAGAKVIDLRP